MNENKLKNQMTQTTTIFKDKIIYSLLGSKKKISFYEEFI